MHVSTCTCEKCPTMSWRLVRNTMLKWQYKISTLYVCLTKHPTNFWILIIIK